MDPEKMPGVAPFIYRLFSVVNSGKHTDLIDWDTDRVDEEGPYGFTVSKASEFSEKILPLLGTSKSMCSFIRQLNGYNFSKMDNEKLYFHHADFRRDHPERLQRIARKKSTRRRQAKNPADAISSASSVVSESPQAPNGPTSSGGGRTAFDTMKSEVDVLRQALLDAMGTLKSIHISAHQISASAAQGGVSDDAMDTSTMHFGMGQEQSHSAAVGACTGMLATLQGFVQRQAASFLSREDQAAIYQAGANNHHSRYSGPGRYGGFAEQSARAVEAGLSKLQAAVASMPGPSAPTPFVPAVPQAAFDTSAHSFGQTHHEPAQQQKRPAYGTSAGASPSAPSVSHARADPPSSRAPKHEVGVMSIDPAIREHAMMAAKRQVDAQVAIAQAIAAGLPLPSNGMMQTASHQSLGHGGGPFSSSSSAPVSHPVHSTASGPSVTMAAHSHPLHQQPMRPHAYPPQGGQPFGMELQRNPHASHAYPMHSGLHPSPVADMGVGGGVQGSSGMQQRMPPSQYQRPIAGITGFGPAPASYPMNSASMGMGRPEHHQSDMIFDTDFDADGMNGALDLDLMHDDGDPQLDDLFSGPVP